VQPFICEAAGSAVDGSVRFVSRGKRFRVGEVLRRPKRERERDCARLGPRFGL
jgi:hypothetical protein